MKKEQPVQSVKARADEGFSRTLLCDCDGLFTALYITCDAEAGHAAQHHALDHEQQLVGDLLLRQPGHRLTRPRRGVVHLAAGVHDLRARVLSILYFPVDIEINCDRRL